MKRRNFIKGASVTGLTLVGNLVFAANEKWGDVPSNDKFVLDEVTIDVLQQKMKRGELSSRDITQLYLERIKKIDKAGPQLNAIIELNPDALDIASKWMRREKMERYAAPCMAFLFW